MHRFIATAIIFVLASISDDVSGQALCGKFRDVIDDQLKFISAQEVDDIGDNSAPRAQLRELKKANAFKVIELNMALMTQNKCPALTIQIGPMVYLSDALSCSTARLKGVDTATICDRSKWKPLTGSAATPDEVKAASK